MEDLACTPDVVPVRPEVLGDRDGMQQVGGGQYSVHPELSRYVQRVGRRVAAVTPSRLESAGAHTHRWDGHDEAGVRVAPGIYLARLVVSQETYTRRIALVR